MTESAYNKNCEHDYVAQTWNTSVCLKCRKIRRHIKSVVIPDRFKVVSDSEQLSDSEK